jgi:hypothetical protein
MSVDALVAMARAAGATVIEAAGATIVVVARPAEPSTPDALIPIAAAAERAATSTRVIRDAIRAGDLPAFGRQRDRALRRADLDKWIESRRARPIAGPADADLERRMRRLARAG